MNKLLVVVSAFAVYLGAFADVFYVDAVNGNDTWDGSAEFAAPDVATSRVGPMKTLAAVAAKAGAIATKSNPCTIIALPGEYKEGVSNPEAIGTAATLNRVRVPAYVTLQSRDGKDVTFIIGAKSDAPNATATGCGTNAVRCVYCANSTTAVVRGFTITGGRTFTNDKSNQYAGGINSGIIVDCIVSNNACAYRGGGINGGVSIGCRYVGNMAITGSNANSGTFYSCFFGGDQAYQGTYYHCTFARDSYPRQGTSYNSLILGTGSSSNGNATFYNCYHKKSPSSDCTLTDCTIFTNAAELGVDAEGHPLSSDCVLIDAGDMAYFDKMSDLAQTLAMDVQPRLQNGFADIGCYESDPCAVFSSLLSPDGVLTVTNVTGFVTGCVDRVSIGANQVLTGTLALYDSSETLWSFFAEVKGSGTLKVYFGDAAEPERTVTAGDGLVEVTHTAAAATGLKLVYVGDDGEAQVSRFMNATRVSIAADGTDGLAISGDITAAGEYVVAPGETMSVTFNRANEGLTYVSGVTVNGTFYNLYDYPDGVTFTVNGSERATSLIVKAVTAEPKELFVDRVNGNDANCGLYTNLAFRSLAKAAAIAKTVATAKNRWTVLALPGVYDNEVSNPEAVGTDTTLNRVTLSAGVTLRALGSVEETVIEGAESTDAAADTLGNGVDAVRCVTLPADALLVGFTLRNGHTAKTTSTSGGGITGSGIAVGCILTNNFSKGRGGATYEAKVWRCAFLQNKAGEPGDASYYGKAYHCYYDTHPYNTDTYGCTFAGMAYGRGGDHYNGLFIGYNTQYSNSPKFHHCYFSYTPAKGSTSTPVLDEACVITNAASLAIDANYRPQAGSVAVDAGDNAYLETVPSGYRDDLDLFGGQRVYNGTVDVGCGEFDWRGDFASRLAKKGVAVGVATANVTTNLAAGLDVPAGESLRMRLVLKAGGTVLFKVVALDGAVVSVTADGEGLTPAADGTCEFVGAAGECEVEIVVTGSGKAVVSDVVLPKTGLLLLLR